MPLTNQIEFEMLPQNLLLILAMTRSIACYGGTAEKSSSQKIYDAANTFKKASKLEFSISIDLCNQKMGQVKKENPEKRRDVSRCIDGRRKMTLQRAIQFGD